MSAPLDALVIGAGSAGLATSYHLRRFDLEHLVLERDRIAETWRSRRWDGFHLVTPNWSIRLPGAEYDGPDPDGFMPRDEFARYLTDWAAQIEAPVHEGVTVRRARRTDDGYALETDAGPFHARNLVVASGGYHRICHPAWAGDLDPTVHQLDGDAYRHPGQLPAGDVLVVGAGQSGAQIAEEINRAGIATWLSVGRVGRLPRRYRGRDVIAWQRDMGYLDRTPDQLEHARDRFRGDPMLSGAAGGHVLSLHDLWRDGVRLLGHTRGIDGAGRLVLADDLADSMAFADSFARDIMARFDAHITDAGIAAPPPSPAELTGGPPAGFRAPEAPSVLDPVGAGIATVIWASGYSFDFTWVEGAPLDRFGFPIAPGDAAPDGPLHFVGQNWLRRRGSGILWGVGRDARIAAEAIAWRCGKIPSNVAE